MDLPNQGTKTTQNSIVQIIASTTHTTQQRTTSAPDYATSHQEHNSTISATHATRTYDYQLTNVSEIG